MDNIHEQTAFITGGAQGIGLAIGRALVAEGAKVILTDLDQTALEAAAESFQPDDAVATYTLDVRDREQYEAVVEEAERDVGPISILCNNAGVAASWPLRDLTFELWDWVIGINLLGVVNGVQVLLPRLRTRRTSHIINTASGAGLAFTNSGAAYHATKYAVVGLSEAMRPELAPFGIGVSVLCPGPVATGIIDNTNRHRPPLAFHSDLDPVDRPTDDELKASMSQSTPAEEVGPMVIRGIRGNDLYVHTDRYMPDLVRDRAQAIVDAVPPSPGHA